MNEQALSVREAIVTRRSIKNFNGQPIEPEIIPEIIEDAVWAPNHGNRNPWRLIVATGEQYEQLLDILKEFGVANWKQLSDEDLEKQMKKFSTASAAVFVIVPEDVRQKERLEDYAAASILIQNIQLLAWDKGIGTCWKTPPFIDHPKFREQLGVEAGERIISMLQFGYFDTSPKATPRKSVEEIITYFGSSEDEEEES